MMTTILMTLISILKIYGIVIGKSLLLSYLIVKFKPLQDIIAAIGEGLKSVIFDYFTELVSCMLCLSFWICLIMSGNIYLSIITYIIAKIYQVRFSHWENWTKKYDVPDFLK